MKALLEPHLRRSNDPGRPQPGALWLAAALALMCPVLPRPALAAPDTPVVSVDGRRILLRDLLPGCTGQVCRVDVGPAAPAGSSRLIDARSVRAVLRQAGASVPSGLPRLVRVRTLADRVSPERFAQLLQPRLRAELPKGVTLVRIHPPAAALLLPRRHTLRVDLPDTLTRQSGHVRASVGIEILVEGELVRRVATSVELNVREEALPPRVRKGEGVNLRIVRHSATVSTQGVALRDVSVGKKGQFRVARTGRILWAKLIRKGVAEVVEAR